MKQYSRSGNANLDEYIPTVSALSYMKSTPFNPQEIFYFGIFGQMFQDTDHCFSS